MLVLNSSVLQLVLHFSLKSIKLSTKQTAWHRYYVDQKIEEKKKDYCTSDVDPT